jgi:hypothetical protein
MDNQSTIPVEEDIHQVGELLDSRRQSGDAAFAMISLLVSLFLLSQIGQQTKWVEGVALLKQPRFWPALCLGGFFVCSLGYLIQSLRDLGGDQLSTSNQKLLPWDELFAWIRAIEFAFYFLIYVYMVPFIGHLPATLIFCPLLTLRAGYRDLKIIGWSLFAGFLIVLIFKSILGVKLPAGAVYDLFPDQIRNFLILYF